MAPLTPFWAQPSHPEIQEVIINNEAFTSKSLSKVTVPPFGLFAKMTFPPCTTASEPTYATVQTGRNSHLNLNSDLVYINHSCSPSLLFDTPSLSILAGPSGLKPGDELTFFYPSTEWHMAQSFDCFCGSPDCRGIISGAGSMDLNKLEGMRLNSYIREMLEEKYAKSHANGTNGGFAEKANGEVNGNVKENGNGIGLEMAKKEEKDKKEIALEAMLAQARKLVEMAEQALDDHKSQQHGNGNNGDNEAGVTASRRGPGSRALSGEMGGDTLPLVHGASSRELGGEMGGDTAAVVAA